MQDPKELNDIDLKNLWLLSPALSQLVPFYASVKQYGLVQAGCDQPSPGEIEIPFTKSAHLNKIFESMVAQSRAKSMNKE